jgi:hypothetical protein
MGGNVRIGSSRYCAGARLKVTTRRFRPINDSETEAIFSATIAVVSAWSEKKDGGVFTPPPFLSSGVSSYKEPPKNVLKRP